MSTVQRVSIAEVLPRAAATPPVAKITVVVPLYFPDFTAETRELVTRFTRTALDSLAELGAELQVIDVSDPAAPAMDEDADGMVLLGGGDIDPTLYGHYDPVENLYGVDRGCDERTLTLIKAAVGTGRPVLGICRGSQLLNVAYGGSLIPDLGPDNPHRGRDGEPMFLDDTVLIEPGSRLGQILGDERVTVRNGHHQAVGGIAPDLRISARGLDGVVEGVEHRDPACWVLGVQWHPEDSDGPDDTRRALFTALLEAAAAYRRCTGSP